MQAPVPSPTFEKRTADYFTEKARLANGKEKMLVALEMSTYIRQAFQNGLSFEELKQQGFKFATV